MKKLIALFGLLLIFTSCDLDDDGPQYYNSLAKVVDIDLPEYLTYGEQDTIVVAYKLPTACHKGLGLQHNRGQGSVEERRTIYIAGVVSVDAALTECNIDADDEELLEEVEAFLVVDEKEPYTFKLFQGMDVDNKPIYQTIVREVRDPEADPDPEA